MNTLRIKALERLVLDPISTEFSPKDETDVFGKNVFSKKLMERYLSQQAFDELNLALFKRTKINRALADQIAAAMKAWALEKGATHYTHWFQPLSGNTAEKHESFFDLNAEGETIARFDGSQLVQQEPDPSMFSNKGVRNTFEARGYTSWDPNSPAFIYENTLCVPTTFVSFTGEALDYKTPLLRSIKALDDSATEICRYFDKNINKVRITLGWEQEYYVVDSALANTRPDLILTGRTLLGHEPSKRKQLQNQYFGSIPQRVLNFLKELEHACLLLGIPLKTRQNEVAPSQFELAPIFEEINLSVDHNALLIDLMHKVASKHKLQVLMHEKPFQGVNGSSKHNNWSIQNNAGVNLLSPGKTPMANLQFLTFFINTIAAVLKHQSLLQASIMSAGNDLRLGENEAPPAILSVFIGDQLTEVLNILAQVSKGKLSPQEKTDLKLNVLGKIPQVLLDNTDSNRTSPFAFTGNKFEFRAVGSNGNCAQPMTVLNAIVAEQLQAFKQRVDRLLENDAKMKKDDAIFNELRDVIKSVSSILFEGDSNAPAWHKEAKKRGLSIVDNTPKALLAYKEEKVVSLFTSLSILDPNELELRYHIDLEKYATSLQVESRTLGDIVRNHIIPTAIAYQNTLIENVKGLKEIYGKEYLNFAQDQLTILERVSGHIAHLNTAVLDMIVARKSAKEKKNPQEKAEAFQQNVLPFFEQIRYHTDKLELLVDNALWPLAKYRELLFSK